MRPVLIWPHLSTRGGGGALPSGSVSKPVYDELVAWCGKYKPLEPPNSLLGQAIRYQLNHHVALMRFLDDGALPIDNGVVERLHRVPASSDRIPFPQGD
jgi:hypothetical protein